MKKYQLRKSKQRTGAILPLVALLIFILLGCLAFAIDVAYMQLVNIELKTSVDAAARAGGETLSRKQNVVDARASAHELAGLNHVASDPLLLDDADIIFGKSAISQTSGRWEFTADEQPYNSVRVIGRRFKTAPSGAVPLFFAPLFGWKEFETAAQSTVVRIDRDIVLIVDRSSSMKLPIDHPTGNMSTRDPRFPLPPQADSRWVSLQGAVDEFISALAETPQVEHMGMVSYASDYNSQGVNNLRASIDAHLTGVHSMINDRMADFTATPFNGMTHIQAGIDEAVVAMFDPDTSRPFTLKTLILMTDGIPNPATPQAVMNSAQSAADLGVKIYTVTFGTAADQGLMIQVARLGDGEHYHADTDEELKQAFRTIALTMPLTFTE